MSTVTAEIKTGRDCVLFTTGVYREQQWIEEILVILDLVKYL
jgi:hypothetical protein